MLKKTISYVDYNGVKRTEDFYFNLSKAEILDMQISAVGGFQSMIMKMVNANEVSKLVDIFKDLILKSYGEKSEDGRRFIKSKEISEAFSQTEAYSDLFMELATNSDEAAKFVNGIIPSDLAKTDEELKELVSETEDNLPKIVGSDE